VYLSVHPVWYAITEVQNPDELWRTVPVLAHLAFGGVLFYGIQKFFKELEEKLAPDAKIQIWLWLAGVRVSPRIQTWPKTFAHLFDKVFGHKHLSLTWFLRCCLASYILLFVLLFIRDLVDPYVWLAIREGKLYMLYAALHRSDIGEILTLGLLTNAIPDYVSLLETRYVLSLLARTNNILLWAFLLCIDFVITGCIGLTIPIWAVWLRIVIFGHNSAMLWSGVLFSIRIFFAYLSDFWTVNWLRPQGEVYRVSSHGLVYYYAAFLTSLWLWVYLAASGILRVARQIDVGFERIKRWFDIENKPLQAIGLVAGGLVTFMYWFVVIIRLM
jgi:hypothetical protein